MILETGTKVLISHRRMFHGDHGRFFVGVVEAYEDGLARIDGYTWLRDAYDGAFHGKGDLRTKIVPITSGTVIVYQLPSSLDLESFRIETEGTRIVARDDLEFEMDLTEGMLNGGSGAHPGRDRVA